MAQQLVRQRIKYLIEYGELYPREEFATKNFVARAVALVILFELLSTVVVLLTMD